MESIMRKTSNANAVFGIGLSGFGGLAVVVWLAASAAGIAPAQAANGGGTCSITTYYSDANLTKQVGTFSNCPWKRGLTGRRTAYSESDTVEWGNTRSGGDGSGGRGYPCEFLQEGCGHLPVDRYGG